MKLFGLRVIDSLPQMNILMLQLTVATAQANSSMEEVHKHLSQHNEAPVVPAFNTNKSSRLLFNLNHRQFSGTQETTVCPLHECTTSFKCAAKRVSKNIVAIKNCCDYDNQNRWSDFCLNTL